MAKYAQMRNRPKYRVRIYDEAHLIDRGSFRISWFRVLFAVFLLIAIGAAIGFSVVWYSPIKKQLPGYMPPDERSKTEEAYLRADSLQMLYEVHQAYLENLLKVMDPKRKPDKPDTTTNAWRLEPDSLSAASEIEKEFVKRMGKAGYKTTAPVSHHEDPEENEESEQ